MQHIISQIKGQGYTLQRGELTYKILLDEYRYSSYGAEYGLPILMVELTRTPKMRMDVSITKEYMEHGQDWEGHLIQRYEEMRIEKLKEI